MGGSMRTVCVVLADLRRQLRRHTAGVQQIDRLEASLHPPVVHHFQMALDLAFGDR